MRVLLLDETYPPDRRGSVSYPRDIVSFCRNRGHTVDVLTVGETLRTTVERSANGAVYRVSRLGEFASARLSTRLLSFVVRRLREYDVIHLAHPNPIGELAFLLARRRFAGGAVLSFHAEVVSAKPLSRVFNRVVTDRVLGAVDRIVVSSPPMAQSPSLRGLGARLCMIPYGIDVDARHAYHAQNGGTPDTPDDPLRILFVGRLVRYKGVEVLLRAMPSVSGTLRVVGDGQRRHALESLCGSLGLGARVTFLGRVSPSELLRQYTDADVLVLPSIDAGEAFGYVLIEAMAQETALITTNLGTGTSWVNLDEVTGLVVEPNDVGALASGINRLGKDRRLLRRFQTAAVQRARGTFGVEAMNRATLGLYETVLGGHRERDV